MRVIFKERNEKRLAHLDPVLVVAELADGQEGGQPLLLLDAAIDDDDGRPRDVQVRAAHVLGRAHGDGGQRDVAGARLALDDARVGSGVELAEDGREVDGEAEQRERDGDEPEDTRRRAVGVDDVAQAVNGRLGRE